jgi:hypothetical protein
VSPGEDQPTRPPGTRQAQAATATRDRFWLEAADGDLLGQRITAWLAMHRVEAAQFARAAGTDRSGLSRALHGKRPVPVTHALRICHHTGLGITGDSVTFNPRHAEHARNTPADQQEGSR